jgi:hypothetical protein
MDVVCHEAQSRNIEWGRLDADRFIHNHNGAFSVICYRLTPSYEPDDGVIMGMRRLILFAAVHLVGTALLVRVSPDLLDDVRAGDPGAALLLIAGWFAVLAGARTTAAVTLALAWRVLRAAGLGAAPLRSAALRVAPRAARTALTAAVGGTLTAAVLAGPALASSPSPAWPLTPPESAPAEPAPAETVPADSAPTETHREESVGAPDPRWPLVDETAAPGADDSGADGSARDARDSTRDTRDDASGSGDQHAPADHHVVVAGDSLWRISADRLPGAAPAEIAAGVQELKDANRDVIGTDANLILPGQRLVLP